MLKLKETIYAKHLAQCWHTVNVQQTLASFVIRCLKVPFHSNVWLHHPNSKCTCSRWDEKLVFLGHLATILKILKCFSYLTSKTKYIFVSLGLEIFLLLSIWGKWEMWVPRRMGRLGDSRGLLTPEGCVQALVSIWEHIKRAEAMAVRQLMKHKHQGSLPNSRLEFYSFWKNHYIPDDNKNLVF